MRARHAWFFLVVLVAVIITVPALHAQYTKAPDAYTITEINAIFGPPETLQIFRDGNKVVTDISHPGTPQPSHTRSIYDLQAGTTMSWDANDSSGGCSSGKFSGDWGDPFNASGMSEADLAKQGAKPAGAETVNGFPSKILEITGASPQASYKAWVDTKYGMLVKLEDGTHRTMIEVKQLTIGKPAASAMALPASCAAAASKPAPPTDAQHIATITGGNPQYFANAIMAPASGPGNSCTVLFKVVTAGNLAPVTAAYKVKVNLDHDATPAAAPKDMTAQIRNGVLRIDNAPPNFDLDVEFSNGAATGLIHRQCFAPQTTLLLIIKNPAMVTDGADWLWSKIAK